VEIGTVTWLASLIAALQWGHVFVDVEMTDNRRRGFCHEQLQWGHVFVDVEMNIVAGFPAGPAPGFNGATSL